MEVTGPFSQRCELVADPEFWDKVVLSNPAGSFFHTSRWIDSICDVYHLKSFKIVSTSASGPTGYLPLVEIKSRFFGHRLISTPFCEFGGIVPLSTSGVSKTETTSALHSFAESIRKQTGSSYIEYRSEETGNFSPSNLNLETSATYRNLVLSGTSKDIWDFMDRKLRNVIRKSSDAGIEMKTATSGSAISDFYKLYLRVQTKRGSPVHKEAFFQTLLKSKPGEFVISAAYLESKIVSAIVTGSLKHRTSWWMNVNDPEYRQRNATSFLLWNLIKEKSQSSSNFLLDLGRTRTDSSIYQFKKQWGGKETILVNLTDRKVALSDPENAKFRLASKIWRILPVSLAKRIGPPVIVGISL